MSATQKLVRLGIPRETAEKLTSRGITTPKAIRDLPSNVLREITGLDAQGATSLRELFTRGK